MEQSILVLSNYTAESGACLDVPVALKSLNKNLNYWDELAWKFPCLWQ